MSSTVPRRARRGRGEARRYAWCMRLWEGQEEFEPGDLPARDQFSEQASGPVADGEEPADGPPTTHQRRRLAAVEWALIGGFVVVVVGWVGTFGVAVPFVYITPYPMLDWLVLVVASLVWAVAALRWISRRS